MRSQVSGQMVALLEHLSADGATVYDLLTRALGLVVVG